MKVHNFPGYFIDIEGLDGSGTSTQVRLVARELKKQGFAPFLTKEPSQGPVGKLIRQALEKKTVLPAASLQLLFAADRGDHLDRKIIPRLEKGEMVITDRYLWSSIAFGSIDLSRTWLLDLNKNFFLPDLTVFIEVSPDVCLERIAKERVGVELFEEEEKLSRAWSTYHSLATKYWWAQIELVNGLQEKKEVTKEIIMAILRHSKYKKR